MRKFLRYFFRIAGAVVCLLFLSWALLAIYVETKKDSLLEKARTEIDARIGGTLRIGHLDISLFRHFPSVSLELTDVSLRDSAWKRHKHDLLKADRINISCSPLESLFHRRIILSKVFLEKGTVYFYTDSVGYSNTYVLKGRAGSDSAKDGSSEGRLPTVILSDVRWVMDRQDQHKLFDLDVRRLSAVIDREGRGLRFDVNTALTARSFSFKMENGSYLRNKPLAGHFVVTYNLASHILQTEKSRIEIDGYPFVFSGRFFPTVKPDPFYLTIDAERIPFRAATSLLTPKLEEKLDAYDIDKAVSVHGVLDAGEADEPQPLIQIRLSLENGGVLTPVGSFTNVSFMGSFSNEWVRGQGHDDRNSGLRFAGFSGQMGGIPFHADSLVITDLVHPQLYCDLHSMFDFAALNDLCGSETLQFRDGSCRADIRYNGPLSENDTVGATVNGQLELDSAAIAYLPIQFALTNINGRLVFRDQDMVVDRLDARVGHTAIRIKGVAKNLISLIDHHSENVSMDWTFGTGHLSLEDFMALAGRASTVSRPRKSHSPVLGTAASRIDNFLKAGMIRLHLDAADMSYENFSGAHLKADLVFQGGSIRLSQLTVGQGSGTLGMRATLVRRPEGDANPVTVESHLEGVDLAGLFRSFDDFGLKGIGARNLKGRMSADIKMRGLLTDQARIVPNSLKGTVDFRITDGQLVDFGPMEKIHEAVLKNRDLSEIRFGPLENELVIDSTTLMLHRMEIESTAFTLYVEGTYDLKTGADMSLQVPLSNLKARAGDVPPDSRGNDSRGGLSLHLRARTEADGRLKISWDPFRKGLKKEKKM